VKNTKDNGREKEEIKRDRRGEETDWERQR
jgi:hypothetical protein